ncbi:MAG: glycyl-radical enzyme activating protein [Bacteroidota bacterium]
MVFNIQHFSVDDGPGIRTTVFLKGCSLRCRWCHNPESIAAYPEIQFFRQRCIGCGRCAGVCPIRAQGGKGSERVFTRNSCRRCGRCAEQCPTGALSLTGKMLSVDDVLDTVEKDRAFYAGSKGGVTFSGGEPLLQMDFMYSLLRESKRRGLHTTVDTAGQVPWENFAAVLPYVDLFLFDLKMLDDRKHRRYTGAGNRRILANFSRLPKGRVETWVRIPIIPGVNDGPAEAERMADFIRAQDGVALVELLPYHRLGAGKYGRLGRRSPRPGWASPQPETMAALAEIFERKGLQVR